MKVETQDSRISGQKHQYLQIDRQLIPLADYAAKEGISAYDVEEFGKIGIVQLRKYKGKTYVVDVPFVQDCQDSYGPVELKLAEETKTNDHLKTVQQAKVNSIDNRNTALKNQIPNQNTKKESSVKNMLHQFVNDTKATLNKNKNRISDSIANLANRSGKEIKAVIPSQTSTVTNSKNQTNISTPKAVKKENVVQKVPIPTNENLKQSANNTASAKKNSISLREILPDIIKLKNELQVIRIESTHALKSLDGLCKKLSEVGKPK